jgi:hypothetical protein
MTLEEALQRIEELEAIEAEHKTTIAGLTDEKTSLLAKRNELLGKLTKFKKFEAHTDVDIDELIAFKATHEGDGEAAKNQYKTAYETDKAKFEARLAQLERERAEEKAASEKERADLAREKLRSAAILEFSKPDHGVFSGEQLYKLIGDQVRFSEAGALVVGDEYKEVAIGDYLKALREDTAYQNQFRGTGATGSGAMPGQGTSGGTTVNPWKKGSFNLTSQAQILKTNPTLAATMKAQAGA